MQKLSLLEKELNKPTTQNYSKSPEYSYGHLSTELPADVDRLEAMMNRMSAGEGEDPEIQQLSTVMDKILDVQHPSRVKERMKEKTLKESANAMTVSARSGGDTTVNGFYSLDNEVDTKQFNAIEAVVNENQVLVNGSVIKLRLLQDVFVGNQKIPAGTFVFGTVGLNGERLQIEISSIRSGNSLFTVKMEVYDMDGLAGIHIPGAITRDVAKQSADNSLQMMELTTLDPSLKAQATAAGISTAKSLLSRKVKLLKVMVKAGYRVLLKDKASP
jgi:conjugative transposon TraM protein